MFWRMAGLSAASPVDSILDKDNYTLEELLDEDDIIQECKGQNGRLINFICERPQIERLVRYIVEEAPEDAEKTRSFKFPFIACEVIACEIDVILKALVEDEEIMNLLFSFLEPDHSHSTLLAGYFSKVVTTLFDRKTDPLVNYIRAHQDIMGKLVELIGITSIMQVLTHLIGADEHIHTSYTDVMQWLEETNLLEMIVDKFSSSDCPKVHANAAEFLCAITRCGPPAFASKVSSPSFIGRLFSHALEVSRPKSVLVNSLSVCMSLLDPKRLTSGSYYIYSRQITHGSSVTANQETVEKMLESLGDLVKLLDISLDDHALLTTYGKLQPPLGKHRLKIIEFISVLLTFSSKAAEKELIHLGAVKQIINFFFEYPYNNFLHHHVEQIIISCLESKSPQLIEHLLHDCDLVPKILDAETNFTLSANTNKLTVPADGKPSPRIGNIGHITHIANKLVQIGDINNNVQAYLQENSKWVDWRTNVLTKRNAVENVFHWGCGRPIALQDRTRDSEDDDYQDREYEVSDLANNLSHVFRYGISSNDDIDEGHGSLDRDDEDVYFDDESAEVVISSLRLGDDQESASLFTNSNWFAFEDENGMNQQRSTTSVVFPSEVEGTVVDDQDANDDLVDPTISENPEANKPLSEEDSRPDDSSTGCKETEIKGCEKPAEGVECTERSEIVEESSCPASNPDNSSQPSSLVNGGLEVECGTPDDDMKNITDSSPSIVVTTSDEKAKKNIGEEEEEEEESLVVLSDSNTSQPLEEGNTSCGGSILDSEQNMEQPTVTGADSREVLEHSN